MEPRTIEMIWRCSSCRVENLGRYAACTGCGHPKDDSEAYEMPGDVARAPAVVDPELLRLADAGENWRCRYCASHQRRLDGACASCGADQGEGGVARDGNVADVVRSAVENQATAPPFRRGQAFEEPLPPEPSFRPRASRLALGALFLAVILVSMAAFRPVPPPLLARALTTRLRVVEAPVAGRRWEHRIYVDRWQKVAHQGFAELRPADAVDVAPLGQRQHHTERVSAGYKTETYTERVADGSSTESYSGTESCGQACTSKPQSCREVCSSSKNGFAKCRQECTGGGQTCTTKTCTVQKTRSVPRYKDVTRTRQIPQYRDEPRYAPFCSWKLWQWVENRHLVRSGTDGPPVWPNAEELAAKDTLAAGERERDRRETAYTLTLIPTGTPPLTLPLATEDELALASARTSFPIYVTPAGDVGVLMIWATASPP